MTTKKYKLRKKEEPQPQLGTVVTEQNCKKDFRFVVNVKVSITLPWLCDLEES